MTGNFLHYLLYFDLFTLFDLDKINVANKI